MTRRELTLAAVVLGILLAWGGSHLLVKHRQTQATGQSALLAARQQVSDARMAIARGEAAVRQVSAWQERSLPEDRETAQSLYRNWLLDTLQEAGLTVNDVKPEQRTTRSAAYTSVGYAVEAHGNLESVTRFLYAFYRSDILQQITRLSLRPETDPSQLTVRLSVEALIVAGATHADSLADSTADEATLAKLDDYVNSITERNVFAVYTPPRPPRPPVVRSDPPAPPKFDDAGQAYVTAIVLGEQGLQAWITVRTTGEVLRLGEGDEVKVGLLDGRIVSIEPRSLVLEADDKRHAIELGHNLRDGRPIDQGNDEAADEGDDKAAETPPSADSETAEPEE